MKQSRRMKIVLSGKYIMISQEGFEQIFMMLGPSPPPPQILLSGAYGYRMNINETDISDVITLCFLVLKFLHQFSCSSYQKQGSPSTITETHCER